MTSKWRVSVWVRAQSLLLLGSRGGAASCWLLLRGVVRDGAPQGRRFEWAKEGEERTQLFHRGVAVLLTWLSDYWGRFVERSPALKCHGF